MSCTLTDSMVVEHSDCEPEDDTGCEYGRHVNSLDTGLTAAPCSLFQSRKEKTFGKTGNYVRYICSESKNTGEKEFQDSCPLRRRCYSQDEYVTSQICWVSEMNGIVCGIYSLDKAPCCPSTIFMLEKQELAVVGWNSTWWLGHRDFILPMPCSGSATPYVYVC